MRRAIKFISASFGLFSGFGGLEHGYFEILPNFLITGILSMLLELATMLWAGALLQQPRAL